MQQLCFNCEEKEGVDTYGYIMCDSCKADMGLFTDKTIQRHVAEHARSSDLPSYEEETKHKLDTLEKVYRKKKIKLLDILAKLQGNT